MKFSFRSVLALSLILATLLLCSGCGELSPYAKNDGEGFQVSVRFDANGGLFATNTSVIVDSFNISGLQVNSSGNVEIPLIEPADVRREREAFEPYNSGYFLAGWYAERTATGENEYSYSKRWDFSKDRLSVAADGEYSASEPVLTLYAVWVPNFTVEYYDVNTGEKLETKTYNPVTSNGVTVPQWDESTGKIDMNDFPKRRGYTFNGVYLDENKTMPVTSEVIEHCGIFDAATGTGSNGTLKLYVDWLEGDWYQIHTAKQLSKLADKEGNYLICKDLDFAGESWPKAFTNGKFEGTIQGDDHIISNLEIGKKPLFDALDDGAKIVDLTFGFVSGENEAGEGMDLISEDISENAELSGVQITVDGVSVHPAE